MKLIFKIFLVITLGLFFFVLIAPIAVMLRLLRVDFLNLSIDDAMKSYWIKRDSIISRGNFFSQFVVSKSRNED